MAVRKPGLGQIVDKVASRFRSHELKTGDRSCPHPVSIAALGRYALHADELSEEVREEIEKHLADCEQCQANLDFYHANEEILRAREEVGEF